MKKLDSQIRFKPIDFETKTGEQYECSWYTQGDDLCIQVQSSLDDASSRCAKAFVDTLGESGMARVHIEKINEPEFGVKSTFIKVTDAASDFQRKLLLPIVLQNFDLAFSTQATASV